MPAPTAQMPVKKTNTKAVLLLVALGLVLIAAVAFNKSNNGSGKGQVKNDESVQPQQPASSGQDGSASSERGEPSTPQLSVASGEEKVQAGKTVLQLAPVQPASSERERGEPASLRVGETAPMELRIDTRGERVVVIETVLTYDPESLKIEKIEGAGSVFPFEVFTSKQALSKPGVIHIVRGIARVSPDAPVGFMGEGVVAKVIAVPLKEGAASISLNAAKSSYVPADAENKFSMAGMSGGEFQITK